MTLPVVLLALYACVAGLLLAADRRMAPWGWRVVAVAGAVSAGAVLAWGGQRLAAIPIIVVAVAAAALAALRSRRSAGARSGRRGVLRAIGRWSLAAAAVTAVAADAAFIAIVDPLSDDPVRELLHESRPLDLSQLPWTEAFETMHARLARAYALGEWKRIDWKTLHDRAAPKIADAARAKDRTAFYLALRDYLWSLHDGHVGLAGDDGGLRNAAIKGGFGLALLRLDDGRTIAHVVTAGGPAARAGLTWGATIFSWDGVPIEDAAARTSVIWNASPPATQEGLALARLKWLARAPVGTTIALTYQNLGEAIQHTATLEAADDQFAPLKATTQAQKFTFRSTTVAWRVLPRGSAT